MNEKRIPWPVIVIACLYLLVGVVGFIAHFPELLARHSDAVGIELTELLAVVGGVGLLTRQNWARWLALAWILLHVGISFFHPLPELAIHLAFCLLIAWALLRPPTAVWFRRSSAPA
jgi:hypothetical protein